LLNLLLHGLCHQKFAPETVVVKEFSSEPGQLSHDFKKLRPCLLVLEINLFLITLLLIVQLLKRFVFQDGLSQFLFVLGDDPTLSNHWLVVANIWIFLHSDLV